MRPALLFPRLLPSAPVTRPASLTELLHACHRAHRARLAALLAPHGLHPGQDTLLAAVWSEPGLRQVTLAERLGVEPATVSRVVERLERGGLLERRRDPHDARLWRIHPTPRSRLLEAMVRRNWRELEDVIVAALGTADAEQLGRLLGATAAALAAPVEPS